MVYRLLRRIPFTSDMPQATPSPTRRASYILPPLISSVRTVPNPIVAGQLATVVYTTSYTQDAIYSVSQNPYNPVGIAFNVLVYSSLASSSSSSSSYAAQFFVPSYTPNGLGDIKISGYLNVMGSFPTVVYSKVLNITKGFDARNAKPPTILGASVSPTPPVAGKMAIFAVSLFDVDGIYGVTWSSPTSMSCTFLNPISGYMDYSNRDNIPIRTGGNFTNPIYTFPCLMSAYCADGPASVTVSATGNSGLKSTTVVTTNIADCIPVPTRSPVQSAALKLGGSIQLSGSKGPYIAGKLADEILSIAGGSTLPTSTQLAHLSSSLISGDFAFDVSTLRSSGSLTYGVYSTDFGGATLVAMLVYVGYYVLSLESAVYQQLRGPIWSPTTAKPTTALSTKPTYAPTLKPTSAPSRRPTFVPSAAPTAYPTYQPTVAQSDLLIKKLQYFLSNASLASSRLSSDSTYSVLYQDILGLGKVGLGGCNPWKVGTGTGLSVQLITQKAASVTLSVFDDAKHKLTAYSCQNATIAASIVKNITMASMNVSSIACGGHRWKSARCGSTGKLSMCVDCINPCGFSQCPNLATLDPCGGGYGCRSRNLTVNTYRVLSAVFVAKSVAPKIQSVTVFSSTKSTATLSVALSADGTVTCGVFATGVSPTSTAQITLQNYQTVSTGLVAQVVVGGLSPVTTYDAYCFTQSDVGTQMSINDALKTKTAVVTQCCKTVNVQLAIRSIYQNRDAVGAVQVSLDSQPNSALTIVLQSISVTGGNSSLVPTNMTITKGQQQSFAASITATNTKYVGNITVSAFLRGPSAGDYQIVYPLGQSIAVLSSTAPSPPPKLISVGFSNDGTYLSANFGASTDKALITQANFGCAQLFNFSGASSSVCQWSSLSSVRVNLGVVTSVVVGSQFTLLPGKLRANCPQNATLAVCSNWAAAPTATLSVAAPLAAIRPVVAISAPSAVGRCDAVAIDLSSSVGGCGREWASITFAISSDADVSVAQSFLNKNYQISPPTAVPAGYFKQGMANIVVTMCNFLQVCGSASVQLVVTGNVAPVVSILGNQVITTTSSAGLAITADAFVSVCNFSSPVPVQSREGLTYQWGAYEGGVQSLALASYSKQFYSFKLNPYSLLPNHQYAIKLTVVDGATGESSSRSVSVNIVPSNLVAVIAGSSQLNMYGGTSATIDASGSYDQDVSGLTGTAAGLSFALTCMQTAPTISSSCGLTMPLPSALKLNSGAITVTAPTSAVLGSVSVITVMVYDSTRTTTASVAVTIQPSDRPLVSVFPLVTAGTKVVPDRPLALIGLMLLRYGAGAYTWSVSDSSINLGSQSLTPAVGNVNLGFSDKILVLPPNSLSSGAKLTFTLSCTSTSGGFTSTASAVIVVNSPPQGGIYTVSPQHGVELLDTFTLAASRWFDSDLPLDYVFGFVASDGSMQTVQPFSQRVFTKTKLPAGQDTANYTINSQMLVYDSYLSYTAASATVRVTKQQSSTADLSSLVSTQLTGASASASKQVVAVVVSIINAVQCTGAPACASLNRKPCSKLTDTCGPCLSNDLIGNFGESNDPCLTVEYVIGIGKQRLLGMATETTTTTCNAASVTSSCAGWEQCINSKCTIPSKSCPNNCGGTASGTCVFVSVDTGLPVSACLVGDARCSAVCSCVTGYAGPFCATDAASMASKESLRLLLIQGMYNMTQTEDAAEDAVSAWISSIATLTQNSYELTPQSVDVAVKILKTILTSASALKLPYSRLTTLQSSIDNVAIAAMRLGSSSSSAIMSLTHILHSYVLLVIGQMQPMQISEVGFMQAFKVIGAVSSAAAGGKNLTVLHMPLTASEVSSGLLAANLTLTTVSAANVHVGMSQFRSELLASAGISGAAKTYSNSLLLTLSDRSVCGPNGCSFNVTLPIAGANQLTYSNGASTAAKFTTHCGHVVNSTTHKCGSQQSVTAACNGSVSYTITSTCPYTVVAPSCGRVLSSGQISNDVCTMASFTSAALTCTCTASPAILAGSGTVSGATRRLTSVDPSVALQLAAIMTTSTVKPPQVITPLIVPAIPSMAPSAASSTVSNAPSSPAPASSAAPSIVLPTLPTLAPVASTANQPVVIVTFVQTVQGVTDSDTFRAAFATAIGSVLPAGSTVTILSVTAVRRIRQLLSSGLQVTYSIISISASEATLTTILQNPGSMAAVTTSIQTAYPAAIILDPTTVIAASPTASPVSSSATTEGASSSLTIGLTIGFLVGFGILFLMFLLLRRFYGDRGKVHIAGATGDTAQP